MPRDPHLQSAGVQTVAVFSEADANAQHVQQADEARLIGGARAGESYLRGDVIIAAALATGAEAIHPGYGFLSENADFARACVAAGLVFIGPDAVAIDKMGSKSAAKALMEAAGVPVVPGYHGADQSDAQLARESARVGYPQLIKAVAGGGGKGMRRVDRAGDFGAQLAAARREAANAFGNDHVLIERFITTPHHIEFQVFGDQHGNVVHLWERECSIQRRHQKVLEETPSPWLDESTRSRMAEAAVAAARAIAYQGAGTIEFIAGEGQAFYFMEMNTRLQVEHPITEMTTGEDLVEWQLRVAAGEALPKSQSQVSRQGHAIEVRLCAENPDQDFLPDTGSLRVFATPELNDPTTVRLDTGVVEGDAISVYYDPMIAKLITFGRDRDTAVRRLQTALAETEILGLWTNVGFLQRLVHHEAFLQGHTDTGFIGQHRAALISDVRSCPTNALVAASLWHLAQEANTVSPKIDVWNRRDGWWLNRGAHRSLEFHTHKDEPAVIVDVAWQDDGCWLTTNGQRMHCSAVEVSGAMVKWTSDGSRLSARVFASGRTCSVVLHASRHTLHQLDPWAYAAEAEAHAGRLSAMMPGRVVKVLVQVGDKVVKGQALMILEAMKMEHSIISPSAGVIAEIAYIEGQMVAADATLVAFEEIHQ